MNLKFHAAAQGEFHTALHGFTSILIFLTSMLKFPPLQLLSVAAMKGITASVEGLGEIEDSGAFLQMPHFEEVLAGVDLPPEVSRLA